MNYLYSPTTNAFYLATDTERYKQCGTLPDDATAVQDEVSILYSKEPTGKRRVTGADGLPAWLIRLPSRRNNKLPSFLQTKTACWQRPAGTSPR